MTKVFIFSKTSCILSIMWFWIETCAILIMKSGRRQMVEWIKLPNQETIREKETSEYLGIMRADMEEKKNPPGERKLTPGLVRYSGPFFKSEYRTLIKEPGNKISVPNYISEMTLGVCVKKRRRKRTTQHSKLRQCIDTLIRTEK